MKSNERASRQFSLKTQLAILLLLIIPRLVRAQDEYRQFYQTERVGERTVLIKFGLETYTAVAAVASSNGLVVIDTGVSHTQTALCRKIIEQEFGRNDFIFVVNTHSHYDHSGGNQIFPEAVIVGHEKCREEMVRDWEIREEKWVRIWRALIARNRVELQKLPAESDRAKMLRCQNYKVALGSEELMSDRILCPPVLTFSDKMSLELGDITVRMIYFGKAHTESDIIIHIPEEKILFTGDLFMPGGAYGFEDVDQVDVVRWNSALEQVCSPGDSVEYVIHGHGMVMDKEDLLEFYKRIKERLHSLHEIP